MVAPVAPLPPLVEHVRRIILRDLAATKLELEAYEDEKLWWKEVPGLKNPAGTLALHMIGNLRHFIGAVLGDSDYVRDREGEFNLRYVPASDLYARIDAAVVEVGDALLEVSADRLEEPFPVEIGSRRPNTGLTLVHLTVHLGYHLGQLNYHRRTVTGRDHSVVTGQIDAMLKIT